MKRMLIVSVVACLVVALTCPAYAGSWKGKQEVREGVKYIVNTAQPMDKAKEVSLKELWRIGGDTDDEDEFFGVISQILTDENDHVYLLDTQLAEVKIFSPSGEYVRTIGREGEGPGEFQYPTGMFFMDDGNVAVMQVAPGKIVILTREGEPAGEHPIPTPADGGFLQLLGGRSATNNLVLAMAQNSFTEGKFAQTRYLASVGKDGTQKAKYSEDVRTIDTANAVMDDMEWDTFDRRWTLGADGRVYSCETYPDYRIHVYQPDGTVAHVIEREYQHRKRSDREKEIMNELMGLFAKRIPNCTVKITEWTKDIETIYVREDGSLWVLNSNGSRDHPDGTLGVFDVFDREGRYLRQITLKGEGDPLTDGYHFVKDRLYVVTDLLQAAISLQAGGQSFDISDEEPEPMSVICYELATDILTTSR